MNCISWKHEKRSTVDELADLHSNMDKINVEVGENILSSDHHSLSVVIKGLPKPRAAAAPKREVHCI